MDVWLKPVFADLIENKKFSDCRILVGNKAFDCHKVILASSSEFFERLFLGSFRESESGEIRLQEVKPATFAMFIQYAYTYSIEMLNKCSNSMLMELVCCGNRWLVDSLVSEGVKIVKKRVNDMLLSELFELFQSAHSINHKELVDLSVNSLITRFPKSMNCCDVLSMTSDVFEQYTIITKDVLPEIERFKMIEAYVTVNGLIDSDLPEKVEVNPKKEGDSGIDDLAVVKLPKVEELMTNDSEQESSENGEVKQLSEKSEDTEEDNEKNAVEPKNEKIKKLHLKYVQTLLGYIQYNKMGKYEFHKTVGKSSLLTLQQKYNRLYLCKSDSISDSNSDCDSDCNSDRHFD